MNPQTTAPANRAVTDVIYRRIRDMRNRLDWSELEARFVGPQGQVRKEAWVAWIMCLGLEALNGDCDNIRWGSNFCYKQGLDATQDRRFQSLLKLHTQGGVSEDLLDAFFDFLDFYSGEELASVAR